MSGKLNIDRLSSGSCGFRNYSIIKRITFSNTQTTSFKSFMSVFLFLVGNLDYVFSSKKMVNIFGLMSERSKNDIYKYDMIEMIKYYRRI